MIELSTDLSSLLLDDDPFANLSFVPKPLPVVVSHAQPRPKSSGHGPAYTRPAFAPRPSLPSLHALAQMNVAVPGKKLRKGTPGARLPHEPWNMDLAVEFNLLPRTTTAPDGQIQHPVHDTTPPAPPPSSETRFVSREIAVDSPSLSTDETFSSRSLSCDDADMDSLPSLSYTTSEPSSSTISRSSPILASPQGSMDPNISRQQVSVTHHVDHGDIAQEDDDDPLSYHSDFDYYTQSLSDLSDSDPDLDPATGGRVHSSPLDTGVTPSNSLYDSLPLVQPGTSADTMRSFSLPHRRTPTDLHGVPPKSLALPQDGNGWRGQPTAPETLPDADNDSRGRELNRPNGPHSGARSLAASAVAADVSNEDKAPPAKLRSPDDSSLEYTSSSDDDADGITVYYSLDGMSTGSPPRVDSRSHSRYSKAGGGSDDDVPLAQRVPTALSAQKSIRKQLRDERQKRRLERAKNPRVAAQPVQPTRPTEVLRAPAAPVRSRKRSASAAPAPSSASRVAPIEAFPAAELTKKLMNLQASSRASPLTAPPVHDHSIPVHSPSFPPSYVSRSPSRGRHTDHATHMQQKTSRVPEASFPDRTLKPMRSFHRSTGRPLETQRPPNEQTRLGHSATVTPSSRATRASHDVASAGHEQHTKSGRVSEDGRKLSASVRRPSVDKESDSRAIQRPPVPPLPLSDSTLPQHVPRTPVPVVQQRIFIGDMQRFNIVEILPVTNAGDVIKTVASQGMLDRSGSWMLFEMAQDYGMERPIRDYEILADVSASWNKDKLLNAFVIKQTPLAPLLSRSTIPTSSPTHRGWVEWESKRGKWSKRWMELREHGLWLSKRETGKDEIFLCSLSNFDAYFMTRRHKSPKPFAFAIKSTDHLSLFENAADYLHIFSCNPKDGEKWMQVILVARSYVLYQERHVLFAKTGEVLSQAKPLTRSGTRKHSISSRPTQPLVSVPPPFSQAPSATIAFEPGSLLAKRKGDAPP